MINVDKPAKKWEHHHEFQLSDGRTAFLNYGPPRDIVNGLLHYDLYIDGTLAGSGTHTGPWDDQKLEDYVRKKFSLGPRAEK